MSIQRPQQGSAETLKSRDIGRDNGDHMGSYDLTGKMLRSNTVNASWREWERLSPRERMNHPWWLSPKVQKPS